VSPPANAARHKTDPIRMDWPILIPAAFLSRDQGFQPKSLERALPELKIGSAECVRLKRNCSSLG
jgi:hypothetical protein